MSTLVAGVVGEPAAFLHRYPDYETTRSLDGLRATEYGYLDELDQVYLDYTGSGLAAASQYQAHHARLATGCFGNPHSVNPSSRASTELVDRARRAILAYFNASPNDYAVIFTANASGACRLVGEAYPFDRRTRFVLTADNHNSVNGIREFARARKATTTYVPSTAPDLRVLDAEVRTALGRRSISARRQGRRGLFAYPAQSNFSGVQHSLDWVELAHRQGYDVLLDAAAYLPTNPLDLSVVTPEFVTVSWYKLFGYPTGVGCLVARREALARLRRPWFSGGTIQTASVLGDWHSVTQDESAFEDGTLNFLAVPDVEFGLSWLTSIGIEVIQRRVRCLTGWLLDRLAGLTHDNGAPMARIYGPRDTMHRGGTVAFNLLDPTRAVIDERLVATESATAGFSLRTGCFCNPGASEAALGITRASLRGAHHKGAGTLEGYLTLLRLPSGGAIRVSFGVASTIDDLQRLLSFVEHTYRNRPTTTCGLLPRTQC
ncbi:MAG: cysteine desulfurase [Pseudonocardiales bacterium]|nr:aminotransferase class V-fold PLP-dependent enzyme [Actinomycetota bacterium]PZS24426.1 MAG: cysteine desulfurase [Pseudonocardiales bacterium]